MRKFYARLKAYALALILLTTTSVVIYSCKKDRNNFPEEDYKTTLKNWFEKSKINGSVSLFASLSPNWQSAIQTEINGTVVLEIEVNKPNSFINKQHALKTTFDTEAEKTHIKLLLFKDKNGDTYGCYMMMNGVANKPGLTH